MTTPTPATARATEIAEVLSSEAWDAVSALDRETDLDEIRATLVYFLGEAAHETDSRRTAQVLRRSEDLLRDPRYVDRLIAALGSRFEPLADEVEPFPSTAAGNVVPFRRRSA